MNKIQPWGIHWFRRDLRLLGNSALSWNCKKHDGRVLGIFSIDRQFLARPDFSNRRFGFFLQSLTQLQDELRQKGGDLLVLDQGPDVAFAELLQRLKKQGIPLPSVWSWNRDYEPFAISRDARIQRMLEEGSNIPVHTERDHLLIEPAELFKADEKGTFYQVFTPFSKKWLKLLETSEIQERLRIQKNAARNPLQFVLQWAKLSSGKNFLPDDVLDDCRESVLKKVDISLPSAGEQAARAQLKHFKNQAASKYADQRDFPAVAGTSQLAIHLKHGAITVPQIIAELGLGSPATQPLSGSQSKFLGELIWREFYYHILAHVPRVEHEAFQKKYAKLPWRDQPEQLQAWKDGQTGFPIIDAGMRQLNATGWMHNRVRMIVASFLTKDLHCNWQHGEKYFMLQLLDGDLAPNNGGWQWAASTGCDAQPYFRIFNPTLQSQRFDAEGSYIRKWVPELAGLSSRDIHQPWLKAEKNGITLNYPRPIVDHSVQGRKAVEFYRQARG